MDNYSSKTNSPSSRKRCTRYDVEGAAHMLTFSCFKQLPLFSRERTCLWMLDALRKSREKDMFDLWAFVIMPEHVHIVMRPGLNVAISQILKSAKQSVARRAINWCRRNSPEFLKALEDVQPNGKRTYRFWQRGGGYDRNLRSASDVHEKIDYVHANPVRRKLVERAEDWPWSSNRSWGESIDEPLLIDRNSVPMLTPVEQEARRRNLRSKS